MAGCHARARFVPRSTQDSEALALVRETWPAFRDRLEERAGSLSAFVRDELEALLTCGDFEHGFLIAQRQRCGDSLWVPFACKSRGICPSCIGRRMAETFVEASKAGYVYIADLPDPEAVFARLPARFDDYNEHQPHTGLNRFSPRRLAAFKPPGNGPLLRAQL